MKQYKNGFLRIPWAPTIKCKNNAAEAPLDVDHFLVQKSDTFSNYLKAKNSLQDDEYSSPTFASLLFMESSSLPFVVGSESMNLQTRNALMYSQRHGFVTLHEVQGNM